MVMKAEIYTVRYTKKSLKEIKESSLWSKGLSFLLDKTDRQTYFCQINVLILFVSIREVISASSIIARETLSLMLPEGLNDSSLAKMLALILSFLVILFTSTRGVFPITFNIFFYIINNYSQTYNTYRYSIQSYYDFKICICISSFCSSAIMSLA